MMTTLEISFNQAPFRYPPPIETELNRLADLFAQTPGLADVYPSRWLAIQALEGDEPLMHDIRRLGGSAVAAALDESLERLRAVYGDDLDVALVDQRYRFVHTIATQAVRRPSTAPVTLSDRIDRVVTHRWLGIPIFLAVMWVVFKLTTDVASPFVDWLDSVLSGPVSRWVVALLALFGADGGWIESLMVDGVVAGVGGVLAFVPVLLTLYFALAVLEDSGYMARAAFVMDRLMRALGLHGKSFSADDCRLRLLGAGDLRHAHARQPPRPDSHRSPGSVHELQCAIAGLRADCNDLFPCTGGAGDLWVVPHRHCSCGWNGGIIAAYPVPSSTADAIRSGVTAIPYADAP